MQTWARDPGVPRLCDLELRKAPLAIPVQCAQVTLTQKNTHANTPSEHESLRVGIHILSLVHEVQDRTE